MGQGDAARFATAIIGYFKSRHRAVAAVDDGRIGGDTTSGARYLHRNGIGTGRQPGEEIILLKSRPIHAVFERLAARVVYQHRDGTIGRLTGSGIRGLYVSNGGGHVGEGNCRPGALTTSGHVAHRGGVHTRCQTGKGGIGLEVCAAIDAVVKVVAGGGNRDGAVVGTTVGVGAHGIRDHRRIGGGHYERVAREGDGALVVGIAHQHFVLAGANVGESGARLVAHAAIDAILVVAVAAGGGNTDAAIGVIADSGIGGRGGHVEVDAVEGEGTTVVAHVARAELRIVEAIPHSDQRAVGILQRIGFVVVNGDAARHTRTDIFVGEAK